MKKRDVVKLGVEAVVTYGVTHLANQALTQITIPADFGRVKSIGTKIGAFAIVSLVSAASANHINSYVDQLFSGYDAGLLAAKQRQEAKRIDERIELAKEQELSDLRDQLKGDDDR